MLDKLYILLICHMIGDYILQTDFLAKTKGENWWHLTVHSFLYSLPFYICYGIDWKIWTLIYTHFAIDMLKARYNVINYLQDQILHIIILIFLYANILIK